MADRYRGCVIIILGPVATRSRSPQTSFGCVAFGTHARVEGEDHQRNTAEIAGPLKSRL